MKNSKQEAIEEIARFLEMSVRFPPNGNLWIGRAKRLYNRIAPLREFPDKALKDLLLDADLWTKEALFWKIKCLFEGRLWEGQDHIAEVRKKVCPVCGGKTGKSTIDGLIRGDWFICPGCQRVVFIPDEEIFKQPCQHKGDTQRQWGKRPYCYVCNSYFDQRSGKERRVKAKRRDRISDRRRFGLPGVETFGSRYTNRRDGKDRRR